ncbi:MAG: amino acid permease [Ferruginibacter sp.]
MSNQQSGTDLKRTIGVFGLACGVVNITIGTGIFVLPALAAEHLGAAAIICFLVCGLLIFLIALCFGEVGGKVTESGGTYAYIETAFGPFAGFLANNLFLFGSCVLSDAAVANALSKTLANFFPVIDSSTVRPFFFLILFGGLAFINIRSTKAGVRFIIFTTVAKLIPLLLIIFFGVSQISAANLEWKTAFSFHDIGATSLVLFYAFLGIETVVTNSGEFKNPGKTVPLGILSGLSFVLLVYIVVQLITQGILGDQLLSFKEAPLTEVSKRLFGYTGITLVTAGVALSMLGNISGEILAVPRVLFAGARDGIFPAFLAKVHPKYVTPHFSVIVYSALGYIVAVFGAFKQLIILSSAATLLIYLGVVLAAIRLRYKKITVEGKTFIIPGGITVPVLAAAIIIWILSNLSKQEMIGIVIAILALSLIYFIMRWYKNKQVQLTAAKPGGNQPG